MIKLPDIFWDYYYTEDDLNDLLFGKVESIGSLTRHALLQRMFSYMSWFDIVQMIDRQYFLEHITPEFINSLKEKDLQQGLMFVRRLLHTQTVSAPR